MSRWLQHNVTYVMLIQQVADNIVVRVWLLAQGSATVSGLQLLLWQVSESTGLQNDSTEGCLSDGSWPGSDSRSNR